LCWNVNIVALLKENTKILEMNVGYKYENQLPPSYNAQANPQRVTYSSSVYYATDQKPPAGYLMQNTLCLSLPTCLCQHICQHCNTVKKTVTYTMLFHQAPDKVVAKNAIQEPFNTFCCGVCLNLNSNPGHLLVLIRGQHETLTPVQRKIYSAIQ
jgi:hypothetical protein